MSVVSILGCNTATARAMLIYFQWDTERLFGALVGIDWLLRG